MASSIPLLRRRLLPHLRPHLIQVRKPAHADLGGPRQGHSLELWGQRAKGELNNWASTRAWASPPGWADGASFLASDPTFIKLTNQHIDLGCPRQGHAVELWSQHV